MIISDLANHTCMELKTSKPLKSHCHTDLKPSPRQFVVLDLISLGYYWSGVGLVDAIMV